MHPSDDANEGLVCERSGERAAPMPVLFRYKEIGSNILLTVAAAVVPLVIVGVSAFTVVNDRERLGGRPFKKP